MSSRALIKLRKLCLALPEAREIEAWNTPTFRVKTMFAMYAAPSTHHGDGREGVWIKGTPTNQSLMVQRAPDRFFVPPYTGPFGWIGVYLDSALTDWDELAELLEDGWRMSAPKKLVAAYDAGTALPSRTPKSSRKTTKKGAKRSATRTTKTSGKRASTRTAKDAAKRAGKRTSRRQRSR